MEFSIETVGKGDEQYPPLLKEAVGAPESFYYRGTLPPREYAAIAIVGTRKATREGKAIARMFAQTLAQRGFYIVSGLAFGIDAAAHEGALEGEGKTIAVLAQGLDTVYPREHESLAERILARGGTLISEYSAGTPSYPNQFLERNRIVSGLSIATIVIEAPKRSGALVTARHALDQGKEVFVVPGPTSHPNYAGSHFLIRNGARLITSIDDILEDLPSEFLYFQKEKMLNQEPERKDELEQRIVTILKEHVSGVSLDNLIEFTDCEPSKVNQALAFLSLDGVIEERTGMFILKQ